MINSSLIQAFDYLNCRMLFAYATTQLNNLFNSISVTYQNNFFSPNNKTRIKSRWTWILLEINRMRWTFLLFLYLSFSLSALNILIRTLVQNNSRKLTEKFAITSVLFMLVFVSLTLICGHSSICLLVDWFRKSCAIFN